MRIRLVNLDRCPDRLAAFAARNPQLQQFERFSAADGSKADKSRLIANNVITPDLGYSDGALGCALSHLIQWRDAIEQDVVTTVIEDDAILAGNFESESERLLQLLPKDWEYVMWGYNFDALMTFDLLPGYSHCHSFFDQEALRRRSKYFSSETVESRLFPLRAGFGTVCYSISPRGARRLLDFCMPLRPMMVQYPGYPRPLPNTGIDNMIACAWSSMDAYVAFPPLVVTDNDKASSTVQVQTPAAAEVICEQLKEGPVAAATGSAARKPERRATGARVPRTLHYVFGMAPDFGGKPWSLVHHACLSSAIDKIRPDAVLFHYEHEPSGPWWDLTKPLVTPQPMTAPTEIFGNPLLHVAHRAGVTRLKVLLEHGGIYLDSDVMVHRAFDNLLGHSAVMGIEGKDQIQGLADAVIVAERNSPFIRAWFESYRTFRSKGRDEYWAEHAVWMPARIAASQPELVHVLPHTAFFWPLWTPEHIRWIYESTQPIDTNPYANHLWEAVAWNYFKDLTPGRVRSTRSNFHSWLAPYVRGLPDDYGQVASPALSRSSSQPVFAPQPA